MLWTWMAVSTVLAAQTPSEYKDRAAKLEEKARKHDAEADRMDKASRSNPMLYKWPAMVKGPIERERRLAMEARRAAAESLELAAREEKSKATKPEVE